MCEELEKQKSWLSKMVRNIDLQKCWDSIAIAVVRM